MNPPVVNQPPVYRPVVVHAPDCSQAAYGTVVPSSAPSDLISGDPEVPRETIWRNSPLGCSNKNCPTCLLSLR